MRLLLIRHGQTPANVLGQLDTSRPGPGLTPLGERQAALVPRGVRTRHITAIYASTLLRTQLTAEPLATDRGLDIQVLDGLQEIEAGALEKRSDRASVQRYLETVFAWGSGDVGVRMPGGTDGNAFFDRFDNAIASAAEMGSGTAAFFSHGAAIRVWAAARAHNVPSAFAGTHELDNTGVVELSGSPEDGWTLLSWAGQPVGGAQLVDQQADDPTGEPLDEA
ncbi:MAG: histidine phosphatase family protein [Lacisediminihabitans sp.]